MTVTQIFSDDQFSRGIISNILGSEIVISSPRSHTFHRCGVKHSLYAVMRRSPATQIQKMIKCVQSDEARSSKDIFF